MRLGNLRQYLSHNTPDDQIRARWIMMAARAIALIHRYGIVHADISTRNFLVADDLSIKLCDFAGSAVGDVGPLVEEEDRYRMPCSSRSTMTDIFALGCLIFEIGTGLRPFDGLGDDCFEDIRGRYLVGEFPCLDGLLYRVVVYKCWTGRYESVDLLLCDLGVLIAGKRVFDRIISR
ncbi:kinase-like domain-containing protein [Aspergillus coremiiformis]|uniref:EKC/KEOPS complex subunit BUD32 n=1 Tax=Aspergillus coremiiformis TaxID=138285 RepID=A0A5N6Z3C5_9EURO|nr:kinase-like domain-containing protein [Aspergillus coremiiformis]